MAKERITYKMVSRKVDLLNGIALGYPLKSGKLIEGTAPKYGVDELFHIEHVDGAGYRIVYSKKGEWNTHQMHSSCVSLSDLWEIADAMTNMKSLFDRQA